MKPTTDLHPKTNGIFSESSPNDLEKVTVRGVVNNRLEEVAGGRYGGSYNVVKHVIP